MDIKMVEEELQILKQVDHPNIVAFFEAYHDKRYFHFVTEFCQGGDLFEYVMQKTML